MSVIPINIAGIDVRCAVKNVALNGKISERYKKFIPQKSTGRDACFCLKIDSGSIYDFENALRIFYSGELILQGGFLLHSAGICMNGRAVLFAGVSGSGKSTLSSLFGQSILLSDEIVAVKKSRRKFVAYATPFRGEVGKPGPNIAAKIAALLLLKKSSSYRISRINGKEAVKHILRNVLVFSNPRRSDGEYCLPIYDINKLLNTVSDFSKSVEIMQMSFALRDLKKIKDEISNLTRNA